MNILYFCYQNSVQYLSQIIVVKPQVKFQAPLVKRHKCLNQYVSHSDISESEASQSHNQGKQLSCAHLECISTGPFSHNPVLA